MAAFRPRLPSGLLATLRGLSSGARPRIPTGHAETLLVRGFASAKTGVLSITPLGHAELAMEITRASWLQGPD